MSGLRKHTLGFLTVLLSMTWGSAAMAQPQAARSTLTLDQARALVAEQNWDYTIARTQMETITLLEDRALAIILPSLSLTGVYTLNDQELEFAFPNPYTPLDPWLAAIETNHPEMVPPAEVRQMLTQTESEPSIIQYRHDLRAIASLQQTLFAAPFFPAVEAAELAQDQVDLSLEFMEMELQGGLAAMYFGALRFQRFIEVSERIAELAEIQFNSVRIALEEGVGNQFEVYRAEIAHSTAVRNLDNARVAYELMIESIANFLQIAPDFDVVAPAELSPPTSLASIGGEALESRPDLRGADTAVDIAEEMLTIAEYGWFPVAAAEFQAMFQQESQFGGEAFRWSLSVVLSWSILDGGLRSADIEENEINLTAAEMQREQATTNAESALRQSWMRVQNQQLQLQSSQAEAELAQRTLDLTQEARILGAATALDVQLAQAQLYLSEIALADAQIQLQAEIYELYRQSGNAR